MEVIPIQNSALLINGMIYVSRKDAKPQKSIVYFAKKSGIAELWNEI